MKFKISALMSLVAITSVHLTLPAKAKKCPFLCSRAANTSNPEVVLLSVADLTTQGLITPDLFHLTAPSVAAFYFPNPKNRTFLTVADLRREITVAYRAGNDYLVPSKLLIAALNNLHEDQEALVNEYIAEYAKDMHSFQTTNLRILLDKHILIESERILILNNLIWLQVQNRIERNSTSTDVSTIVNTDQEKATRPENLVTYDWKTKTYGQLGMIPVTR